MSSSSEDQGEIQPVRTWDFSGFTIISPGVFFHRCHASTEELVQLTEATATVIHHAPSAH